MQHGALRGRIAEGTKACCDKFNFLWVDWPMFEWSEEEGRYMSAHHPTAIYQAETMNLKEGFGQGSCHCL